MIPSSSNFRTRFDTVLRLASTAFAISRNDFRASAFKSRRIFTSRSSRRAGAIVSSPRESGRSNCCVACAGRREQCFVYYQYFGHLYDLDDSEFIYVPNSARDIRRAPPVRPGGKDMAIAQSTPAKARKMTVATVLKQIETEKIRWIDPQFVHVLGALPYITITPTSPVNETFNPGAG